MIRRRYRLLSEELFSSTRNDHASWSRAAINDMERSSVSLQRIVRFSWMVSDQHSAPFSSSSQSMLWRTCKDHKVLPTHLKMQSSCKIWLLRSLHVRFELLSLTDKSCHHVVAFEMVQMVLARTGPCNISCQRRASIHHKVKVNTNTNERVCSKNSMQIQLASTIKARFVTARLRRYSSILITYESTTNKRYKNENSCGNKSTF